MQKIGKYEVVRKIGQGGFGVVFEGRDPFIKRRVAIKTCSTEDEEIRKRFFREAEIAGNLQHRHVVTVFDLGVQDGVPYLVQEYLPGEDLAHKIKRRDPLDDYTKLSYLVQVAEGLEYAHAQGVVHRDIKPANIRILEDDSVKIMDFGIAKLASAETQLTHTGMAMGTAGYLPPEQIRGEKVDLRADIFSYGVMSYELLAGQRPFVADNMSAVLFQIIGQEPAPLSSVWPQCPPALERLVKKSLAKNPAERYASFTPLLADLRPIREQVKGNASPVAPTPETATQVISTAQTAVELETLRSLEKRLRDAVEKGDLTAAELELTLARKRHRDSATFSQVMDPLMARIAEIRKAWEEDRQRSERLSGLVERARALRAEKSLDEARIALTAALDLDPNNEEVQSLLRTVDEAIEKKQYEEREREGARAAGAEVERLPARRPAGAGGGGAGRGASSSRRARAAARRPEAPAAGEDRATGCCGQGAPGPGPGARAGAAPGRSPGPPARGPPAPPREPRGQEVPGARDGRRPEAVGRGTQGAERGGRGGGGRRADRGRRPAGGLEPPFPSRAGARSRGVSRSAAAPEGRRATGPRGDGQGKGGSSDRHSANRHSAGAGTARQRPAPAGSDEDRHVVRPLGGNRRAPGIARGRWWRLLGPQGPRRRSGTGALDLRLHLDASKPDGSPVGRPDRSPGFGAGGRGFRGARPSTRCPGPRWSRWWTRRARECRFLRRASRRSS